MSKAREAMTGSDVTRSRGRDLMGRQFIGERKRHRPSGGCAGRRRFAFGCIPSHCYPSLLIQAIYSKRGHGKFGDNSAGWMVKPFAKPIGGSTWVSLRATHRLPWWISDSIVKQPGRFRAYQEFAQCWAQRPLALRPTGRSNAAASTHPAFHEDRDTPLWNETNRF